MAAGNSGRRVIVVGAGAAGLMAAGQAARAGAEVILLEKMQRVGRKLCITGKGRCNLTNIAELPEFIEHFGKNGRFLRQAFHRFFAPELIDFFQDLGLPVVRERGGRVFPQSGKAPDVVKVLRAWVERAGVRIIPSSTVTELETREGRVVGVVCGKQTFPADAVILAVGGRSYPATGSQGDGYRLAAAVGHRVVEPRPALVPLEVAGDLCRRAAGLQLRNVEARLLVNNKRVNRLFGELLFMEFGLSGPLILTMSLQAVDGLRAGHRISLLLDLKPALDERKLDARLQRDFQRRCHEPLASVLRGLLPAGLVDICLEQTGLNGKRPAGETRRRERAGLRHWLKNFRLEITGYRGFAEAIITAGGVDLREVEPKTMESKRVGGLFIVGELLDLQGDTGGYNLQAAFSTGFVAGRAAAGRN